MSHRKQRLREFLARVWSSGDIDAVDRFVAPLYKIHHDPGDRWEGQTLSLTEFKDRVYQSRSPFPDQRFDVAEMIEEANRVAVTWHWSGTHLGDIPGFKASGRLLTMSGATVYGFEGNGDESRLNGHWQIVDRLSIFRQLRA